ncbi:MAG: hypothetical protein SGI73_14890 [Chloroflexota bacterium]|nr:hypothetical protein [Chloroflexota bacterium]
MNAHVPPSLHQRAPLIVSAALVALSALIALAFVSPAPPIEQDRRVAVEYAYPPQIEVGYTDYLNTEWVESNFVTETYPSEANGGALQIARIELTQTRTDQLSASVTIDNTAAEPISGVVWLILAPPDSAQPWTNAIYTTPERTLQIPAASNDTLIFAITDAPPGDYDLSVWVHTIDADGTRTHSDGQGIRAPIYLGDPYELEIVLDGRTLTTTASNHALARGTFSLSISVTTPDDPAPQLVPPIERAIFDLARNETITRSSTIASPNRIVVWLHSLQGDNFRLVAARAVDVTS